MIADMDDDELEKLISEPLEPVLDEGFSEAIVARLEKAAGIRKRMLAFAFFLSALCFAAVLTPIILTSVSLASGWHAALVAFLAVGTPAASLFLVVDS